MDTPVELTAQLGLFRSASELAATLLAEAENRGLSEARHAELLGLAAYQLRAPDLAAKYLSISFDLENRADLAARTGISLWQLNRLDEAADWTRKAIQIDPGGILETNLDKHHIPFFAILAAIQFSQGNVDAASESLPKALKINPDNTLALAVQSKVALIKGDYETALSATEAALKNATPSSQVDLRSDQEMAKKLRESILYGTPFLADADMLAKHV